jgi:hypothetical protein
MVVGWLKTFHPFQGDQVQPSYQQLYTCDVEHIPNTL